MTKETEKAFVIIYAEYLRRRRFGTPRDQATQFDSSKLSAIDAFSKWNPSDIQSCLSELRKLGYVRIDILGDLTLQESGIEYMESKPNEYFSAFFGIVKGLAEVVSYFLSR